MTQQTYGEWMRSNPPIENPTAVEWLIAQVNSEQYQIAFGQTYISIDLIEQAKQMEKEQIIKAHGDRGWAKPTIDDNGIPQKDNIIFGTTTGEQYYNETYGK